MAILVTVLISLTAGAQYPPLPARSQKATSPAAVASSLFRQGEQLLRRGSSKAALEKVNEGLKLEPASANGYDLLGLVYEQEKLYTLSTEAFQRALRLAPHSTAFINNLGNSYMVQGKPDLAESEFRASLRLDPANRNANYGLGLLLLSEHRPKEAIRTFQRVRPAGMSSRLNLVRAYLQAGEIQEGLATAQHLSEMAKRNVRTHFMLGVVLAADGQYAAGIQELEAADALQPGTFDILYNLGQAYLRNGDTAKAQDVLARALKLRPASAGTLYFLGQTYANERQDLKALEILVQAHKLAPRNTDVIFLMARLSMKQSFYEDAIPLLESGVMIAPNRPDLHAALGDCYFMSGKVGKAIQEFQTLIKLDPSARSYAFMGLCYRHLGRFDEAKKYLREGLKANPRNAACLYNMGYIAGRQGRYAAAEKWLENALHVDPKYGDALLELASVKVDQKKFEEAIPLLRRCAHLDPHPAPVYYQLAMAERDLHQETAAERDLKVFQTLSRDPKPGPYPFQHLFGSLDRRAGLPPQEQSQLDLAQLEREVNLHPNRPRDLYLLAEAYLNLDRTEAAEQTIAQLDNVSQGDFRTMAGVGVLLARHHRYPEAVAHFKKALQANPRSDDTWYDLADAYFRAREYSIALAAVQHISRRGQNDASYTSLLGDIEANLGQSDAAVHAFQRVIAENPDKDQNYLSLAMVYLRTGNTLLARQALEQGLLRTPDSGEIFWGMGVLTAVEGKPQQAERYLKRAVNLLPEWPGSYSALGVLYYQTGEIKKAREILEEFMENGPRGALNVQHIEQALSAAAPMNFAAQAVPTLPPRARKQFLAIALTLADQAP